MNVIALLYATIMIISPPTMPPVVIGYMAGNNEFYIYQQQLNDTQHIYAYKNVLTQIWSQENSNIALVAHNYLAGKTFKEIYYGEEIKLFYENGDMTIYQVIGFKKISFETTIREAYTEDLNLQTCEGNGALIILAEKIK